MNDATAIGRAIREARLAKGMSLGQLAAAVGRSSSSVRRWERGEVAPAIGIVDDVARVLDLDPDVLRELRPQPVSERADTDESDAPSLRPSTLEQPVVDAPEDAVAAVPVVPPAAQERPPGFLADLVAAVRDATSDWSGWIRGLATAGVLLVMVIILIWAMGELADALGEIWDSFDTESTG